MLYIFWLEHYAQTQTPLVFLSDVSSIRTTNSKDYLERLYMYEKTLNNSEPLLGHLSAYKVPMTLNY